MNKNFLKSAVLSVVALAFFVPTLALAVDTNYVPLTTLPGVFEANTPTNPVKVVRGLYGLAIGVGSVIAVVMVIYAGFEYMFQESITGKSDARQRIINAFLGLAVILGSYILLRTLNPALVEFDVTLQGSNGRTSALIAAQKEFDAARKRTQEAIVAANLLRQDVSAMNSQIADLEKRIANNAGTTTQDLARKEADEKQLADLQVAKLKKTSQESYIRSTEAANNAIASMQEYAVTARSGLVLNIDSNIQKVNKGLDATRALLEDAYAKTKDPEISKRIEAVDLKKFIFRAEASQLRLLADYKERTWFGQAALVDEEGVAEQIKQTGAAASSHLRSTGNTAEADRLDSVTKMRMAIICPKCK